MAPSRRVLLLSARMGAGHQQVALELARRLRARGHVAHVADLLSLMARPAGAGLAWVYPAMVNRAPWLYDTVYRHFFLARQSEAERASIPVKAALCRLQALVARFRPDLVVSTYHLAGVAAAQLRALGALECPALTMITTFGVHELWLHPATDAYVCITPQAAEQVRERSVSPVFVTEPVVRPAFWPRGPVQAADRRRLAPGAEHVALIVAGSLGLGPIADAAATVAGMAAWCPVVVCGRNEKLQHSVAQLEGAVALGWVADMAAIFAASDVVVDNAAGSSAKEALALGRPVVTYRPLPGHGRHDALMMQEASLTELLDGPEELRRALERLASPIECAERVRRAHAIFGVDPADTIEGMLGVGGRERAA